MSFLTDLKADIAAIPAEAESAIEHIFGATWTAIKPILISTLQAVDQDVVANAANPTALMATALAAATAAVPQIEAAGISAIGTTILGGIVSLLSAHPAVVAAAAPATTTAS